MSIHHGRLRHRMLPAEPRVRRSCLGASCLDRTWIYTLCATCKGGFPHPHAHVFRTHFKTGRRRGHSEGGDQSFNFLCLMQVLPLLALFMYTFFSGSSEPPYKMSKGGQFTMLMNTKSFNVPFYVKSRYQFDKTYPKRSCSRAQIALQVGIG